MNSVPRSLSRFTVSRVLLVALLAFVAVGLFRVPPKAAWVAIAGTASDSVAGFLQTLRPTIGNVIDTVDMSRPGIIRVALRRPSITEAEDAALSPRRGEEDLEVVRHVWTGLRGRFGAQVGDTVEFIMRRGIRWDIGLPGKGSLARGGRFTAPAYGWALPQPMPRDLRGT